MKKNTKKISIISKYPPTDDFSIFPAYRRPREDLPTTLKKKYQKYFCYFEKSPYRRLFEISTYRRPPGDLPTSLKNNPKKCLTYNTICAILGQFGEISPKFPPTDVDLRIPPTDDCKNFYMRLLSRPRATTSRSFGRFRATHFLLLIILLILILLLLILLLLTTSGGGASQMRYLFT